jgi:hypothetical protein
MRHRSNQVNLAIGLLLGCWALAACQPSSSSRVHEREDTLIGGGGDTLMGRRDGRAKGPDLRWGIFGQGDTVWFTVDSTVTAEELEIAWGPAGWLPAGLAENPCASCCSIMAR